MKGKVVEGYSRIREKEEWSVASRLRNRETWTPSRGAWTRLRAGGGDAGVVTKANAVPGHGAGRGSRCPRLLRR